MRSFGSALVGLVLLQAGGLLEASCPGQNLLPNPRNPAERGPHPVSTRRLHNMTQRAFQVDVFYPAIPGSEIGAEHTSFDLRENTPPGIRALLTDELCTADSLCPEYRDEDGFAAVWNDLALDTTHGPYPVVFYVHGTAGWSSASLKMQAHWASRGFIVVGINYPGITLRDLLGVTELIPPPPTDQAGDTRLMHAEMQRMLDPQLQWLVGHVDMGRVGVAGHSAGGSATGNLGDIGDVIVPMAGGSLSNVNRPSALMLAGEFDGAAARTAAYMQYEHMPKRLMVIERAGHQFCSDLCWIGRDHGGIADIAERAGVWQAPLFRGLANGGCNYAGATRYLSPEEGWRLSNAVVSGTLEETLRCDREMTARDYGSLAHAWDYRQQLPGRRRANATA